MAWSSPYAYVAGQTVTAANLNTYLSGNLQYLYDNRYGVGRRNAIINSHMDVWQRGTSFALSSSTKTYTADRWACYRAATGCTVSRQTGPTGQAYAMRVQRDSGNASTTAITAYHALESLDSYKFAGQTAYLKLTMKAGANFSAASSSVTVKVTYGTGTDQSPEASWTGTTDALSTTQVITTTATSYDFDSISIPSSATQIKLSVAFTPVGTASTNDWFEISAAQLTVNPSPTYERLTYMETLALCQRYYWQWGPFGASRTIGIGHGVNSTSIRCTVPLPVPMRITPAVTFSANNDFCVDAVNSTAMANVGTLAAANCISVGTTVGAGLTAGVPYLLNNDQDQTNAAIYATAEL